MRHGDPNVSWHGYKESTENDYLCTYFVNGSKNNILYNIFKKTKKHINDKIHNIINHKIDYPIDQIPTTGFFAYLFFKKIYDNEIILLGFNFFRNGNGWVGHNSEWEKEYVKKNNINIKMDKYVKKF